MKSIVKLFKKMSRIGTRISKFNEFSDFERFNLYGQDTIKLYSQYLSEILNNHNYSKYI